MESRFRKLGDRTSVGLSCEGDTVYTKQSFRDECDINILMASYRRTGVLTHLAKGLPSYGDFTSSVDYHDACNQVLDAQLAFAELPSEIRTRFDNDPKKLLEFLEDPANREEGEQLGLFEPEDLPSQDSPAESGAPEGERAPESVGETTPE